MQYFLSLENFLYKQLYKFFFCFFSFTLLLFSIFFCGFIDLFFVKFEGVFCENTLLFYVYFFPKNFVYEFSDILINSSYRDYSFHNLLFFFFLSLNRLANFFFYPFFYFIGYSSTLPSGFIYFFMVFYIFLYFFIIRGLFRFFIDY
jgi:hypothetical protein